MDLSADVQSVSNGERTAPNSAEEAPAEPSAIEDSFIQEVGDIVDGDEDTDQASPAPSDVPQIDRFFYLRVFAYLLIVVALIIIVGYVTRKIGRKTTLLAGEELGEVLGRVYLSRGAVLHFVKAGGRVLVIGVTNTAISHVAEFDSAAFETEVSPAIAQTKKPGAGQFAEHLQASSQQIATDDGEGQEDDEIASLRGDIQRLQRYLQEETRARRA